ncbi:MAG: ribosome recycling factor [Rhodospirillales bacterium]|nr:ribosome recycling factor [Rhodospirillales bacterium]
MSTPDIQTIKKEAARKMHSAVEVLQKEFAGLRTGRAAVSLLEPLNVEAYGSRMPLTQLATIAAPEPRLLTVQVWDRGMVKAVERAILEGGLGLNPATEGQVIRLPVPPLSEQRRVEITKIAARYAEEARVAVRNVRRHAMDELKKAEKEGGVSQDQVRDLSKQIQELTDQHIHTLDDLLTRKESEILQV